MTTRWLVSLLMPAVLAACTSSSGSRSDDNEQTDTEADASESSTAADDSTSGGSPPSDPTSSAPVPRGAVDRVCERLDDCGFLPPGIRKNDCTDTTRSCIDMGLESEQMDWELFADACLMFQNCFNFVECYDSLACSLDLDQTADGSGSSSTGPGSAATVGDEGSSSGDDGDSTSGDDGIGSDTTDDGPVCEGTCSECAPCAFAGPCEVEMLTCNSHPTCLDLNDCYADCDNSLCDNECDVMFPSAVPVLNDLFTCALDVCPSC